MARASIPAKPLAVSRAKKKLPVELDWGPGIPKDRLTYINAKEEALVKRFRKTKAARDYAGVRAYPDPGDTAAGEKGLGGTTTGKTTDKGTGNASTGQGGQNNTRTSGPSGAGQGPNSSASTSKSPTSGSTSTSSTSSSTSTASGGSKAPNAAAQAASDKLNSKTSSSTPAKTNAAATAETSKAPNKAAAYASQKLNASQGIQKASSQPQSIQGMINSGTSTQWGGADPRSKNAAYPSRGDTPGSKPEDKYNVPNWGSDIGAVMRREAQDIGVPNAYVDNSARRFHDWSINKLSDFYGRTPQQISEMARTTYGEAANQGPLGMAAVSNVMENRLNYGKAYNGFGRGDVEKMLSKFDANGYDYGVRRGVPQGGNAAYQNATVGTSGMTGGLLGMADALDKYSNFSMTAPAAVQNATHYYNPRDASPSWGQGFTAYGNHVFGNPDPGPTADRIASLREGAGLGTVGLAAAAPNRPSEPSAPPMQAIPEPTSIGMMGAPKAPAVTPKLPVDPRLSMPVGGYPAAQEIGSPPGYFSQFAMTPQDMETLKKQAMKDFSFGQLMEMRKNMDALPGFMGPITKDQQRVAQMEAQPPQAPQSPQAPQTPQVSAPIPNMRPASQNMQTPPGWGQERLGAPETYTDTTTQRDPQAAMGTPNYAPQPSAPLPASIPGFNPPGLVSNFRGTAGQAYTGNLPGFGYSPLADGRPPADSSGYPPSGWGPSTTPSNPDTYQPQAGPGDQVAGDNPMQGPSNPMQEGPAVEDPAVKSERQKKYASRGATIGSIIAGPIGAIVGGTLGWQMGKTTPGQRMAIAGSPQALNANVQSINQLAEERGGKGNPQMRVTDKGLKDVLQDPVKVTSNPKEYTTLEQMLAALAQGIDPETGKPI